MRSLRGCFLLYTLEVQASDVGKVFSLDYIVEEKAIVPIDLAPLAEHNNKVAQSKENHLGFRQGPFDPSHRGEEVG